MEVKARRATARVIAVGAVVLVAAGVALKDAALEQWYSARLQGEDSEVRAEALEGLERMFRRVGSRARRRLLPRLIDEWSVLPAPESDPQLQPMDRLAQRGRVLCLAFSPDGQQLASGSEDGSARLWSAGTWQPQEPALAHDGAVRSLTFSPDGSLLATGSKNGTARLWKTSTGESHCAPLPHQGWVASLVFSPDGETLLSATGVDASSAERAASTGDGSARLWDVRDGSPRGEPLQHNAVVICIAFSPDGKWVATGSRDHTARIWDARSGEALRPPLHTGRSVTGIGFTRDGQLLVTAIRGGAVRVWDVSTGETRGPLLQSVAAAENSHVAVKSLQLSRDGRLLATGGWPGVAVDVWRTDTWSPHVVGAPLAHTKTVRSVRFSPDARLLASASEDGTVRLTNLTFGSRLLNVPLQSGGGANAVDFSPNGRWLAVGCREGVWIWSLPQGIADLRDLRLRTWATLVARPDAETDGPSVSWGE